jgi:diguanylate cyclase (GGDEF)-like protein
MLRIRSADALAEALWGADRRRRIRLQQWSIAAVIYALCALLLLLGARHKLVDAGALLGWAAFVTLGMLLFYALMRSGWSELFEDASLTAPQILFAIVCVAWGYLMCGPVRSATLLPLALILSFGAFSLSWQRMAMLTGCALAAIGLAMLVLHRLQPGRFEAQVDVANFLCAAIVLPAGSLLAVRLSALRSRLRAQRVGLETALARIHDLAIQDALTGLVNRRHMQSLLETEQRRSARNGEPLCLALIDLDHFKQVNDRHGHPAGDAVLKGFAEATLPLLRATDVLARWGGEEFMLLMPASQLPQACAALERVRARLAGMVFEPLGPQQRVTLSAGIADAQPGEALGPLIERADRALYHAKSLGRDCVVAAGPSGELARCGPPGSM